MPTTDIGHTPSSAIETTEDTGWPRSVRLSTVTSVPPCEAVRGAAYEGAITALCGAAGAGKSTLARQMAACRDGRRAGLAHGLEHGRDGPRRSWECSVDRRRRIARSGPGGV